MAAVPPFNGSLQELRARWRELMPLLAHSVRPATFDGDGTLMLAVLGHMSIVQRRMLSIYAVRAIAVIDGVAVRRVQCRHVPLTVFETL